MEMSYLKLYAKKRMVKSYFKCFCIGTVPFITIFSLIPLNYYLFILLSQTDFSFTSFISQYANTVRLVLMSISIVLSFFIWNVACLYKENYFYGRVTRKGRKHISFRQYITYFAVSILKFLLSISWSAVYLSPAITISVLLIYSYRYENYGYNVNLALFVSAALLFIIGISFLFVSLKRYSMCSYVLLTEKGKNPLKIIEKSINLMEGNSVRYSFYLLSFVGWALACVLVIPTTYVIPYVNLGKWCFFCSLTMRGERAEVSEKPIIFYIKSQTKKVGG